MDRCLPLKHLPSLGSQIRVIRLNPSSVGSNTFQSSTFTVVQLFVQLESMRQPSGRVLATLVATRYRVSANHLQWLQLQPVQSHDTRGGFCSFMTNFKSSCQDIDKVAWYIHDGSLPCSGDMVSAVNTTARHEENAH